MNEEVVIDQRYCGPSDSANGGFAAGLVAAALAGAEAVEVTLRLPPPLGRPLQLRGAGTEAALREGDRVIATAAAVERPDLELPAPVSLEDAEAAAEASFLRGEHPFPECFVCGTDRERTDGLGIVAGMVEGRSLAASPWPTEGLPTGDDGGVAPELVWSALDCPGGIVTMADERAGVCVLGRIAAALISPVEVGPVHVAAGWPIGSSGRKFQVGTVIFDPAGEPVAYAAATWIELQGAPRA